jgi:hypothetical protein
MSRPVADGPITSMLIRPSLSAWIRSRVQPIA